MRAGDRRDMLDNNDNVLLSDFLSSVPPALTLALVHLAPCISLCKAALQISSWSLSWYPSWLALAAWWAICLFLDKTLRLFLPFIVFAIVAFVQRRQRNVHALQPPTTEQALRAVITDLTVIQSLLPSPSLALPPLTLPALLRAAVSLYIPYTVLSFFIPFRVTLAIAGTFLLTHRAPWAIVLRVTLARSAFLRWSLYKSWALLTGTPLPARILSPQTLSSNAESDSGTPVQSLRFLFTIYENQRWWMGLDWTAALLPGERPSWCSALPLQHPLPPPNAFSLPENTTVYLPDDPSIKKGTSNGGRVKRTATWKWEEPEWRVVVHKDGAGLSRVERPLPDENAGPSTSSSRLLKAAGRLRESSSSGSMHASSSSSGVGADSTKNTSDADAASHESKEIDDEEPLTDPDGWVYGDNKWEAQSNRGGMGKYTRFRRWTRVAVVFEVVERIPEPADDKLGLGIQKQNEQVDPPPTAKPVVAETFSTAPETILGTTTLSTSPQEGGALKQRLRMALNQNKGLGLDGQQSQAQ